VIADIESATPALCRVHLATELRRLRIAAGMTSTDVVGRLAWGGSKLTRLETAENGVVDPADVIALCGIYGADRDTSALLESYAKVTKTKKDWWQVPEYRQAIPPGFKAYLGLEAIASSLHNYESEFVPGLLQTEDYVRAIHQRAHEGLSVEEIDRLVAVRMTRQEVLSREDSPLRFAAIINEAVLHRRVGSDTVMRAQLAHIAELAFSTPNIRVQVVPYRVGAHPGMNGAFTILQFNEQNALTPIVYLENLADEWVTRREGPVSKFEEAFTGLQALAPGPQESLSMIQKASKEH
jgi:hypothetical protein